MITIRDDVLHVDTATLTATIRRGFLISLRSKSTGAELVAAAGEGSALRLLYLNQPPVDVVGPLAASISLHRLNDHAAQVRFDGWDAEGVLTVGEDPATGDLLLEPSAQSSRAGVHAVRWRLPGIGAGLELVAPLFQGARLALDDPLLQQRWQWPHNWEAGFVILQDREGGFWVHCRDDRYRYKGLDIAGGELGFDTEAHGPLHDQRAAGGLTWRINVHDGDWQVPAGRYREWLRSAYHLDREAARRKPWHGDIRFALSWYNGDPEILDALAERLDPRTVLIHYSQWRTDIYDQNYPDYVPSAQAVETFAKARAMGFHLMPHANSVDMDPTHPVYAQVRDFEYRSLTGRTRLGWGYDHESRQVIGVPNGNLSLSRNRARNVMIKVHPGLSRWRGILCERILAAAERLDTDTVFIDVTLCSFNLDNCLVEELTSSEGMARLIDQVAGLGGGLAVGGEGLNETTLGLSFAQAHLFRSWQASADGLERCGRAAVGAFLYGDLCRTFGYSRLSGKSDEERVRMRLHEQLGAIPTVTIRSAEEIRQPNEAVARELERAG